MQSSIDVALWMLVDDIDDHKRDVWAYVLTYVDDFLVVGPTNVRNVIEVEISRT